MLIFKFLNADYNFYNIGGYNFINSEDYNWVTLVDFNNISISDSVGFSSTLSGGSALSDVLSDQCGFNDTISNKQNFYKEFLSNIGLSDLLRSRDLVARWRARTLTPRFGYGGTSYGDVISYGDGYVTDVAKYYLIVKNRKTGTVLHTYYINIVEPDNPDQLFWYPYNVNVIDNSEFTPDVTFEVYQVNTLGILSLAKSINYLKDVIGGGVLPTEISGCDIWYDTAQDNFYHNQTITSWKNRGNLTGTSANMVVRTDSTANVKFYENRIVGFPSLYVPSGGGLYVTGAFNYQITDSTFIYFSKMVGPNYGTAFKGNDGHTIIGYKSGYYDHCEYDINSIVNQGTQLCSEDKVWKLYGLRIDKINGDRVWYFYRDGSFVNKLQKYNIAGPYQLYLNGGVSQWSDFEVTEVLAYNRLLTLDELGLLNNYFRHKYGMSKIPNTAPSE